MEIEPNDSFNGENASGIENLPIQKLEKELQDTEGMEWTKNEGPAGYEFSTDSSVRSESGAEILLRTESGIPIMDSHGFLLGEWSWIDDLSLPIM
ncbi:hypothetical protein Leryth_021372 [Lithospermum erythrorhizon]|nr:hypothetical protein Leryth_021372 [Lithospermum erythrorhizon]